MLEHRPLLLAVAVCSALLCIVTALPMPRISSPSNAICDCPKPNECDKYACPGGCFYNSTIRQCIAASVGFYAQLTNASAANLDTPCPCGSFSPVLASVACSACPVGQFAGYSASKSCDVCPAGTQCPYTGMCSDILCAVGTYSSTAGSIGTQRPPVLDRLAVAAVPRILSSFVCRMHRVPPWFLLPIHWHGQAHSLSVGTGLPFRNLRLSFRRSALVSQRQLPPPSPPSPLSPSPQSA